MMNTLGATAGPACLRAVRRQATTLLLLPLAGHRYPTLLALMVNR